MGRITAIVLAAMLFPVLDASSASRGEVTHIVLFWLKRAGNVDDQNVLARVSQEFRRIRGVTKVQVGRSLPVERPEVEQSFDLAVVITFRGRGALEKFERDPRHQQAVATVLRPLLRRYVVYNFVNE